MKIHYIMLILGAACWGQGAGVPRFTENGFPVPQPGQELPLPASHGSHPDFRIEWWYLTGHLVAGNRSFGYQATFFRYALHPPHKQIPGSFGTDQLFMTHMAISDQAGGNFHYQQRLNRGGWDAAAEVGNLAVRHANWSLMASDPEVSAMRLRGGVHADVSWDLTLEPVKPLVRFGEDGTSRKGADPLSRSYYLSFTRLQTTGTVTIDGNSIPVTGLSWMDHEIASSQLEEGYVGWDWIAIQLDDGWEVKAYLLRDAQNQPSEFSALIWISPDNEISYRDVQAFSWNSTRQWTSPHTDAVYPIEPVITAIHPITGNEIEFNFVPVLDDQELVLPGTTYWEGAGRIRDRDGRTVGKAFLELVGYAGPITGLSAPM